MFELTADNVNQIPGGGALLTTYGALSLANQAGFQTTLKSFRSYVSRTPEMSPAAREGRQPLFDPKATFQFAAQMRGRRMPHQDATDPGPLVLHDYAAVTEGRVVVGALKTPPVYAPGEANDITRAYRTHRALKRFLSDFPAVKGLPSLADLPSLRHQAVRLGPGETPQTDAQRQEMLLDLWRCALEDWETLEAWIPAAQAWAKAWEELNSQLETSPSFEAWLREVGAEASFTATEAIPAEEFAQANRWRQPTNRPHRDPDTGQWNLEGHDISRFWLVDLQDQSAGHQSAECVLTFNEETKELFFEESPKDGHRVFLLATLPRPATFWAVRQWAQTFTWLKRIPGAAGLLRKEIDVQEAIGWRGLARITST